MGRDLTLVDGGTSLTNLGFAFHRHAVICVRRHFSHQGDQVGLNLRSSFEPELRHILQTDMNEDREVSVVVRDPEFHAAVKGLNQVGVRFAVTAFSQRPAGLGEIAWHKTNVKLKADGQLVSAQVQCVAA